MVKKDPSTFLSKNSSYEEQESLLEDDDEEEYEQPNVKKANKTITKEKKPSLRGRPTDDKGTYASPICGLKPNTDQINLNCLLFKFRLDVMSTDEIRDKYNSGNYNSSSGLHIKEEDTPNLDNEDNSTIKKRTRRQKSKEDLKSEIKEEYKVKSKNKKNKESSRQNQDKQMNSQNQTKAMEPLHLELGRGLTETDKQLVDLTTQTKVIFENFFFRNYNQMKKEYKLLDELAINILKNQSAANLDIESQAERVGCNVIPPFFWKVIAEIFQDTFNSKISPFHHEIFGSC